VDEVTTEDESWWADSQGKQLPFRKSKPFIGGKFSQEGGGVLRFGLLNEMIDLEIVLSMLHSQTDAKLLANPRVLVLDNETAQFQIVREIPYTDQTATTGATMAQTRFKDVGVQLQVTPHIARAGMIRLHIVPQFSVAEKQERNPVTGDLEVPAVNTRKVDTRALVRDGRTVVMGGLRKQETTKGVDKMPLLGDIPLLGNLFKFKTETEVISEVVVFITPKIITEAVLSEIEVRQLESTQVTSPSMSKVSTERDFTPELQDDQHDTMESAKPQGNENKG
jgi:type II secretory pathway component GspD/PulD (secretin)